MADNYYIQDGYTARQQIEYFEDTFDLKRRIVHQPYVYPLAAQLGRLYQCSHIIDIGCGQGRKLIELHPEFGVVGLDFGENIQYCRQHYDFGQWLEFDLDESGSVLELPDATVQSAVIICSDVIEHLQRPEILLDHLSRLLDQAPVAILTTPDRDALSAESHLGPPINPHHVREWTLDELVQFMRAKDLRVEHAGRTMNNDLRWEKATSLVIAANNQRPPLAPAPDDFRVVAIMVAYNEADIIGPSLRHLIDQGIDVYVIDNWSDDGTYEQAQALLGKGVVAVERFPADPDPAAHVYNWEQLLERVEGVAQEIEGDWFIFHDVDELRLSPWLDTSLRYAIYHADACGFNAIDHTVIEFKAVDDGFQAGSDFAAHFDHYIFGKRRGLFNQIKAWKNTGSPIRLADVGGHHARFEGQRVYPYKFLLCHYPLRSKAQARRKIQDRQTRSNRHERAKGWHTMYDTVDTQGLDGWFDQLCKDNRAECQVFDPVPFYRDYLVERLTGIGLSPETPSWDRVLVQTAYRYFVAPVYKRLRRFIS